MQPHGYNPSRGLLQKPPTTQTNIYSRVSNKKGEEMVVNPKNRRLGVRLSDEDFHLIEKKADKLGMSVGIYLRFLGLNVDLEVNKFTKVKVNG
jgi:hypothetical protein